MTRIISCWLIIIIIITLISSSIAEYKSDAENISVSFPSIVASCLIGVVINTVTFCLSFF